MKVTAIRKDKVREIENRVYDVIGDMRLLATGMCNEGDVDAIAYVMNETRKLETMLRTLRMRLIPRD